MNQREKIILLKYGSKLEAVCNLNIKNKNMLNGYFSCFQHVPHF